MVSVAVAQKILSKVDKTTKCWEWKGYVASHGYGRYSLGSSKKLYAHRVMYYLYTGVIPEKGMVIDHLCRNRSCVNPKHMEVVTIGENVFRGASFVNISKGMCKSGKHLLTEDNIYYQKSGRACKQCIKERVKK